MDELCGSNNLPPTTPMPASSKGQANSSIQSSEVGLTAESRKIRTSPVHCLAARLRRSARLLFPPAVRILKRLVGGIETGALPVGTSQTSVEPFSIPWSD